MQFELTPLICAAEKGHADCVRLLLDAGADTEAKKMVRRQSPEDLLLETFIFCFLRVLFI